MLLRHRFTLSFFRASTEASGVNIRRRPPRLAFDVVAKKRRLARDDTQRANNIHLK